MHEIVNTEDAPKAIGPYSQGVKLGNLVFYSGQIGLDPKTMILAKSFDEQLDQILKNIDGLLKAMNLKRSNILKTTVFLTDLSNFSQVNKAYESFFKSPYPARSCVEVSKLPKDAVVEIEVIAYRE